MFAWWGRIVVRLRWLVLAAAAGVLVLGATWGGGVFGDLISGGFDDPGSPSSKAHRAITEQLGRQDVDIIALYTGPGLAPVAPDTAAPGTAPASVAPASQPDTSRPGSETPPGSSVAPASQPDISRPGSETPPGSSVAPASQPDTSRPGSETPPGAPDAAISAPTLASATLSVPLPAEPLRAIVAALQARPEVTSVYPGPLSNSGDATYLAIQLREGDENSKLDDLAAIEPLLQAPAPYTTEIGGLIPFLEDANSQISQDITRAEIISLPILLVLLIFIFRGLVAAATPLMVGILAVLGAFVAVRLLAQVTDVSVFAINIITMLGLGMAIDYSLFVVSRFREQLAAGQSTSEAVAVTLATAGRTVLVSGLTVALALASLLVFPMAFLKSMAWGGMSAVLVAMLAALTALPALLAVLGHRINSLRVPRLRRAKTGGVASAGHGVGAVETGHADVADAVPAAEGGWARLARSVMRRPVGYLVGVSVVLLAMAIPFLRIEFGGFDERVLPAGTESRKVTERLATEFGSGAAAPISVLVNGSVGDLPLRIQQIANVTGTQVTAQRGDATLISVGYRGEPTSEQAREVVKDIRALDGEHMVGGRAAADVDQLDAFAQRLPWMLLLIALSTFVLLFLAFGSVVLPIKAMVMNVISIGASFGVVVWVFQEGHLADLLGFTVTGFLEPANLVLMLAILFGLATDYEVFLLSRVREEWDATGDNSLAVARGLQRTGGIITAAALLLIIVIGGFATGGTATIKLLGVGTVVAVAVDAALVRTLLVPATMRLLGRWNWWAPKPLAAAYRRFGIRES